MKLLNVGEFGDRVLGVAVFDTAEQAEAFAKAYVAPHDTFSVVEMPERAW